MLFGRCRKTSRKCAADITLVATQEAIDKGWFRAERTLTSGDGAPNLATILATAAQIADGMRFLHSRNVVHGDLAGGARACIGTHGAKSAGGFLPAVLNLPAPQAQLLVLMCQQQPVWT